MASTALRSEAHAGGVPAARRRSRWTRAVPGIGRRPGRTGHARCRSRIDSVRLGQRASRLCRVTNASFAEFVDAGGYREARWWRPEDWQWVQAERVTHPLFWERYGSGWHWRGMFELIPLPLAWPVYVSHAEASAFARWRGARLPTEAEFARAAFGSPAGERSHPWGEDHPTAEHGVFDFSSWDPKPAGSHPKGGSFWGVEDLVGNGWEWTSTVFAPFPGFQPMASYPEYSADFFDGEHFVMKGASPATARELLRPTFRNWFRARYPYVYTTFRTTSPFNRDNSPHAICTTPSARRCSRRSATCRGIESHARS